MADRDYVFWYAGAGLRIFGKLWTREEAEAAGDPWKRVNWRTNGGYAYGDYFSIACPEGEAGSNPIRFLFFISEEEFKAAEAAGWDYTPRAAHNYPDLN